MGKKKKNTEPGLQSWSDVDSCLKELCECDIALSEIEDEENTAIIDVKAKAEKLAQPVKERISQLKALIEEYVTDNRAELDGKSKALTFGSVGFRLSSRVVLPAAKEKLANIIKNLRRHKMEDCVVVTETVNKEVLEKYADADIAKIGASRKVEDRFWLETDKEKLRS
jgi:phage host-nuclease inhibitor protein Gam